MLFIYIILERKGKKERKKKLETFSLVLSFFKLRDEHEQHSWSMLDLIGSAMASMVIDALMIEGMCRHL